MGNGRVAKSKKRGDMDLFDTMKSTSCKEVLFFNEPSVGLKAIIAINNTTLGPAICSCKIYDYKDFGTAILDALDLAYQNTLSAALTRRVVGGGSIVLIGDPLSIKSEMYFRALGAFIDRQKGKVYVTPESGTSSIDMLDIKRETDYVLALPEVYGGSGEASESIALGIIQGIKASMKFLYQETNLSGVQIAIQGLGNVGRALTHSLLKEGADLVITDIEYDKIKETKDMYSNVRIVKPNEIFNEACEVFCPCAFGHSINEENAKLLSCKIVAGAAHYSPDIHKIFADKSIMAVPSFLLNAGEIIQVSNEFKNYKRNKTTEELKDIFQITLNILERARDEKLSINDIACSMAMNYIKNISIIKALK
ncbi:MAG: Glu/Leu/Phe/Val dehydrogenase [Oligoflexia bacterium]|nr:Glu/Leu/Phe/Val dehydrogenase [Oligoflexia bacterium]